MSRRQFRETQAVIDSLIDKPGRLTPAESQYLATLGTLIHEYEDRTIQIMPLPEGEMIRFLLGERGLRQKDLAPVFGAESIVSAVLNGRRKLNRRHIERLAAFFQVSPAVFFPEAAGVTKQVA
jgi:HTH-type transcriptional regulator/antitoxin HigA